MFKLLMFQSLPSQDEYFSGGLLGSTQILDQTQYFLTQVKIDQQKFQTLFLALSPWANGIHGDVMAERAFRVSLVVSFMLVTLHTTI